MDVTVIDSLHNVQQQSITADSTKVRADIERALGSEGFGFEPMFLDVPTFVDDAEPMHPEGIAFAISKSNKNFLEMLQNSTFRYRDSEVQEALKAIIAKNDLVPLIRWNRGFGIFVFNLYFRGA